MFSSVPELRTPSTILPAICTVLCLANELKFFSMINSVEEMRSLQLFTEQFKNQGSRSSFSQKDMPILNDPLDVKNQMGTFADAFKEHEYRCEKSLVQRWRSALTEATYLSGYHLTVIKLESQLINKIVKDILERLNDHMSLNLLENSHTIDIGEQESGDKDKEAIQKALIKKGKREMIDEKMNAIIDLVPGVNKVSRKVMVLDEISKLYPGVTAAG